MKKQTLNIRYIINRFTVLIIICAVNQVVNAQHQGSYKIPEPSVINSSAQSQAFEQYLNHRVTEYRGTPDISIPIYEIEIDGLKIPIVLSYNASGIRFRQFDGDVGVGWSLSVGGYRVSRDINGKPDEKFSLVDLSTLSFMGNSHDMDQKLAAVISNGGGNYDYNMTGGPSVPSQFYDGEYDLFSYMSPSANGHFVVTNRSQNTVSIMESNRDKVELNLSNLNEMRITDDSGFSYLFGGAVGRETTTVGSVAVPVAWPVNEIKSPISSRTVRFNYIYKEIRQSNMSNAIVNYQDDATTTANEWYYTGNTSRVFGTSYPPSARTYSTAFVSQIETEHELIKFNRNNATYPHLLSEIVIYNKLNNNEILKRISFDLTDVLSKHRVLSSIQIKNSSSAVAQKYGFSYYLPANTTNLSCDQWQFYKSGYGSSDLSINSSMKDFVYVNDASSGYMQYGKMEGGYGYWFDRVTGNSDTHFFSLKEIVFPTGGYNMYEYENNKYSSRGNTITGAGQRIAKIKSYSSKRDSNPMKISIFRYGNNESGIGYLSDSGVDFQNAFIDETYMIKQLSVVLPYHYSFYTLRTISNNPLSDVSGSMYTVDYDQVTIYEYDPASSSLMKNGKTVMKYQIYTPYRFEQYESYGLIKAPFSDITSNSYGLVTVGSHSPGLHPVLTSKEYFDNNNVLVKKEVYDYASVGSLYYSGVKLKHRVKYDGNAYGCDYRVFSSYYAYCRSSINARSYRLSSKVETMYDGTNPNAVTTSYVYDDRNRVTKTTQSVSGAGAGIVTNLYYPLAGSVLAAKNMLGTVVETVTEKNSVEIGRVRNQYKPNSALVSQVEVSSGSSAVLPRVVFDSYDSYGNPVEITKDATDKVIYLWSYKGVYPIAEIRNATYTQVSSAVSAVFGKTIDALSQTIYSEQNSESLRTSLNNLRNNGNLSGALVTTYTYKPLVGILTTTNPAGNTTYYEYDPFNRLSRIYIKNGSTQQTIEQFNYNYAQ